MRSTVCVILVCVMGLMAGAGCGTDRSAGGYRVAILPRVVAAPAAADTAAGAAVPAALEVPAAEASAGAAVAIIETPGAVAAAAESRETPEAAEAPVPAGAEPAPDGPEEWALEFILWKSNLLGSSFYTADREARRRFAVQKYVARPQSRQSNVFKLPAFSHDEGVREGILTGFGWERWAEIRFYALGYEWAEPEFDLFYDREQMKGHHERMAAALRAATTAEARAYVLEQNIRRHTPAVLSPHGPGTVGVAFVPWSCSTEPFPRFWELISSPDAFDAALSRWKGWRWSGKHREATRRIMAWHVARYDAAITERPELARQSVPATNIARLRKRLGR